MEKDVKDVNNRKEIRDKEKIETEEREFETKMIELREILQESLANAPVEYTIHDMIPTIKQWIATEKGYVNFIKSLIYMDVFEEVEYMDVHDLDSVLEETAEYVLDTDAKDLPFVNPDIIDYFFKAKYDFEQEKKLNTHKEEKEESKEVKAETEKEEKKDESR